MKKPTILVYSCPECRKYRRSNNEFCGACGRRLYTPENKAAVNNVILITVALVIFTLIVEVACLLLNSANVYGILGPLHMSFSLILPIDVVLFSLEGIGLKLYWVLMVTALSALSAVIIWKFLRTTRKEGFEEKAMEKTELYWIAILLATSMAVHFMYAIAANALGYPIDGSWLDKYTPAQKMLLFANASFWEEIASRMLIIGVPMALLALAHTKSAKSLTYLFGGCGVTKLSVVLVFISATSFGIAHLDGWGIAKVAVAAMWGLMEGYLFIRFGLHAAIVLHFVNDWLSAFIWIGVPFMDNLVFLALVALGFVTINVVLKKFPKLKEMRSAFDKLPKIVVEKSAQEPLQPVSGDDGGLQ